MQQATNISFELHFSHQNMNEHKHDHVQRLRHEIRQLQLERQELKNELQQIKENPQQMIKSFQKKLMKRINELRQQNEGIQQLIQKSKIPGYAQMTKKKASYNSSQTPGKQNKNCQQQLRQFQRRDPFESVEMSQKCEVSTCQNFPIQNSISQNPLRPLEPLQNHQMRARAQLTMQLLQVIDRTSQITQQMQTIQSQQHVETHNTARLISGNCRKFDQISKYKQKLLQLLKRLRIREANQEQIIRQYQHMHQQTLRKFRQATQLLNQLGQANNNQNLDDIYAQVLQLQQRLQYINEQLQKLDQNQWLKDIYIQLLYALKKLGVSLPADFKNQKGQLTNESLKQKIDQLAQILMQCALSHRSDQKQKLILLKHYHEQEKENNKRIIKGLQNKQQALSKKLIDLQINN